ncbi:MAG: hypothetical protein ACHREM_06260 [Polyangiales bacterium]
MVTGLRVLLVVSFALVPVGCEPDFGDRPSNVNALRVLAVQSQPAEATPGAAVTYSALVVDPTGTLDDESVDWAYCTEPKPIAEPNDVTLVCFNQTADWIVELGVGAGASGKVPNDACRQFGSDVPEGKPGDPPGRPADPDPTGGYYQPVRLIVPLAGAAVPYLALGQTRIECPLAGAAPEVSAQMTLHYRANENPELSDVVALIDGEPGPTLGPGVAIPAGATVAFRASWPACPEPAACGDDICSAGEDATTCAQDCGPGAHGCGGSEQYGYFDTTTGSIIDRHEAMRVSWFSPSGSFRDDSTGRTADDWVESSTDAYWTAPSTTGVVPIWVVIRDDRGGVTWRSVTVTVQ